MITALSARLLAALLMTGLASQSAEFAQQYLQRLGGAADALSAEIAKFDESAAELGLGRRAAIGRLSGNDDPFVAAQGERIGAMAARAEAIAARYERLLETAPIMRPFILLSDPDWSIARRAFDDYRPALPVTIDGFMLTAIGFLLGWAGGASGHGAARMVRRRRRLEGGRAAGAGTLPDAAPARMREASGRGEDGPPVPEGRKAGSGRRFFP
ncbi:DUF2937 family protein [Fulvimarina sp. 2208YS6-2-32]|uniref:DUF2937 family protein n=1 Tax=Fulvimarina uroteuthidis TaxID=3098149 RepID=A0ABU5I273_9HYPH|nr:DUF2937 family protein [Fulvimarina sp. 2208YS6-2-32]MDY8109472.1 DUF2937 family protein [Fulvimarina sp. 2208YS6-2-32]